VGLDYYSNWIESPVGPGSEGKMSSQAFASVSIVDRAEELILEASRLTADDAPRIALDKLRQSALLLFQARLEIEKRALDGLRPRASQRKSLSTQRECAKGAWLGCTLGDGHAGDCAYEPYRRHHP
jgi:hypothetical protein